MQLTSVILARVLGFVETYDLNPRAKVYYPDLVKGVVEKYGFLKFPTKPEDFDENKGVEFIGGKWGDVTVEKLSIYRNGLLLDTRVSTDVSRKVLVEGLQWAASTFGLVFDPKMIRHWGYLSNVVFHSDCDLLLGASSPISKLAERVQNAAAQITGEKTTWQPIVLTVHTEAVPRKPVVAGFTIQRRAETLFSENKYYSEAPLPTDMHVSILQAFEADILSGDH